MASVSVAQDLPVTATDLLHKRADNSPLLAADPTDGRFVVIANRLDGPDFACALQISGDGGRRWTTANPVPTLPAGAEKCYAPEVAFDRRGQLYFLFLGLHGAGNTPMGAFLTTSGDRAHTFTPVRRVLGPERYMVRMALDPGAGRHGRLHLVWLAANSPPPLGGLPPPPNPIMAAYSDDGGRTFSRPTQVSDPDRSRAVAPALVVGPGGAVHVAYYDLQDDARDYQGLEGPPWSGTWSLMLATSVDGGTTFGPSSVIDGGIVPPERVMLIFTMAPPSVAADRSGRVFVAWHDGRHGDWDAFLRRSLDGGRHWGRLERLNDDPVGNGRHQYLPRLAVSPGGRVDAVFYDRRGNVENRGVDTYFTFSVDHGATFAPNRRLTSVDFDSRIGPRYAVPSSRNLFEFGSRLALLSERSSALAAWTDTRHTGRGPPSQDIFATEVHFTPKGNRSRRAETAGLVLGTVGAGIGTGRLRSRRRKGPGESR